MTHANPSSGIETEFYWRSADLVQLFTAEGNISLWLNFMPKCLVSIYQLSEAAGET